MPIGIEFCTRVCIKAPTRNEVSKTDGRERYERKVGRIAIAPFLNVAKHGGCQPYEEDTPKQHMCHKR